MSNSSWRWLKLALRITAPQPEHKYVLIVLADHADDKGLCYPSYGTLLRETGLASNHRIADALKHWKSVGVLTWRKGWGNTHKQVPNVYQFHEEPMIVLGQHKVESSKDESAPVALTNHDESAPVALSRPMIVLGQHSKVPVNTNVPVKKKRSQPFIGVVHQVNSFITDTTPTGTGKASAEQPTKEESAPAAQSSISDIPPYVEFDGREWVSRRGTGARTTAEVSVIKSLNATCIKPEGEQQNESKTN